VQSESDDIGFRRLEETIRTVGSRVPLVTLQMYFLGIAVLPLIVGEWVACGIDLSHGKLAPPPNAEIQVLTMFACTAITFFG
jgi:hypothetical protein